MPDVTVPDPDRFEPLPPERLERWSRFGQWDPPLFPQVVGLQIEEVRRDYCRMRLPYRPELDQPAGVVHGGALATLVDTVVVPAIAAAHEQVPVLLTLSMTVNYLGAVRGEDAVAHGWVTRRGRRTVFCDAAVTSASGDLAVTASLVYAVRPVEAPPG